MRTLRGWKVGATSRLLLATALLIGAVTGCSSPEARRDRGAGRGADVGNRGRVVLMHEGSRPYYGTPRLVPGSAPVDAASQADQMSRSRK